MNYDDIVSAYSLYELSEKQRHSTTRFHNLPRPHQSYGGSILIAFVIGLIALAILW